MVQTAKRMLLLGLVAYIAVLSAHVSTVTGAEGPKPEKSLQPQGLNHVGVYALRQLDPALTGSGVKFAVICRSMTYIDIEPQNDYRPNTEHNCFKNKGFEFYDKARLPAGISPHSTAICSLLLGEDQNAFYPQLGQFRYQGAAPKAKADIHEFWHFVINNVYPGLPPDADIVTVSIGSQFEYWWTRGIESLAEQHGLIVVAGIGNGLNVHDPLLYPGAGANVIGVGVVDSVNTEDLSINLANFALAYPQHSSFGPTADGRCKPDIVAPGNCLAADYNEPNYYEPTGSWSSFSTPIVAGTIGLLVQKAKQDPDLSLAVSQDSGNCVMKAILLNSATKLPYWHKGRLEKEDDHYAPLDCIQGAGMLNALQAYKHLVAGRNEPGRVPITGWDLNHLRESENLQKVYRITLAEPADKIITATIAWNKHYNNSYPFEPMPEKDTNFRLELWAVDSNDSNNDYLLDYSDSSADNVEHIYCRADANFTNYEVIISAAENNGPEQADATQRYALAWNVGKTQDSDNILWYDLNADGIVNKTDFIVLLENWLTCIRKPESYFLGDINTDGIFDANDLQIFFKHIDRQADWRPKD